MSVKYQQTRRRQRQIQPRTIKKHSQIVRARTNSVVVVGRRDKTETGFIVAGYRGKGIETFFEVLLPGTASDKMRHPKKDRVLRVQSGGGFIVLDDGNGSTIDKRIYPGDELVIKAGTAYRLATTSDEALEMSVVQDSKYAANLELLDASAATADVAPELLVSVERSGIRSENIQPRRGSKARQQQLSRGAMRIPTGQIISAEGVPLVPERPTGGGVAKAVAAMNARPSLGRGFDEEGAG